MRADVQEKRIADSGAFLADDGDVAEGARVEVTLETYGDIHEALAGHREFSHGFAIGPQEFVAMLTSKSGHVCDLKARILSRCAAEVNVYHPASRNFRASTASDNSPTASGGESSSSEARRLQSSVARRTLSNIKRGKTVEVSWSFA